MRQFELPCADSSYPAINMATFVGAGGLRNYVIGKDDREAAPQELEQMKQLVAQAMDQGALGLSTSLQYVPDRFASTAEIVELAKIASRQGGVYFTHQRSESARIFASLDEEEVHDLLVPDPPPSVTGRVPRFPAAYQGRSSPVCPSSR